MALDIARIDELIRQAQTRQERALAANDFITADVQERRIDELLDDRLDLSRDDALANGCD